MLGPPKGLGLFFSYANAAAGHTRTPAHARTNTRTHARTQAHTHTHARTHARTRARTHAHARARAYTRTCGSRAAHRPRMAKPSRWLRTCCATKESPSLKPKARRHPMRPPPAPHRRAPATRRPRLVFTDDWGWFLFGLVCRAGAQRFSAPAEYLSTISTVRVPCEYWHCSGSARMRGVGRGVRFHRSPGLLAGVLQGYSQWPAGLFVGSSSAMNCVGAVKLARALGGGTQCSAGLRGTRVLAAQRQAVAPFVRCRQDHRDGAVRQRPAPPEPLPQPRVPRAPRPHADEHGHRPAIRDLGRRQSPAGRRRSASKVDGDMYSTVCIRQ
jgi:hypothetical protein